MAAQRPGIDPSLIQMAIHYLTKNPLTLSVVTSLGCGLHFLESRTEMPQL
ncbi:MAG: hypothetical protein N2C12_07170 [Planctomycetales bacterium]